MNAQAIFSELEAHRPKRHPTPLLIENSLLLLPLLVVISLGILLLSYLVPKAYRFLSRHVFRRNRQPIFLEDDDDLAEAEPEPSPLYMPSRGLWSDFRAHVRSFKEAGTVLFALEVFRTLCLCALLALSIYATIQAESPDTVDVLRKKEHKGKKHKHHSHSVDEYSSLEWGEFGASVFYTYTLIFSFLLLTLRPATPLRLHIITHLDTLLLLAWCLYAYRDFWPLCTTYLTAVDLPNAVTWSRLAILSVAAVLLPLIRPRTYVPVDKFNPRVKGQIHPEQVAPLLFYLSYEYMTPIIWKAWRNPSLPYEDLPPLADYDEADHLYTKHMKHLDPYRREQEGKKPRHLAAMIAYIFRWELFVTSLMCVISGVAELAAPVGTQQILLYLQADGQGQAMHPLFWVVILFLGPFIGSVAIQYYIFITTRSLVRAESLLTQLLFDHSLRLRMKDSLGDEEKKEVAAEGTKTPLIRIEAAEGPGPEAAIEHIDTVDSEEGQLLGESTAVGSTTSSKGKDKAADAESVADKPAAAVVPGQGMAGKINVLMAADVESIVEGRDLPLVFIYTPIQLALCIVFLYRILSWSALIGMFIMLITLPIPGFLTKFNADFQTKRMVATDARVDVITEAVGALRMLKMFAWEGRMKERIAEKREVELDLIWKRRLMSLFTTVANLVLPVLTMSITYAVYTLVQKKQLTAATVFSSMAVFELVKGQLSMCFYLINGFVTASVSLGRINAFLKTSEMVDEFEPKSPVFLQPAAQLEAEEQGLIRLKHAEFNWGSSKGTDTPGFSLKVEDVTFVKGKINLITGPTGSGKSSFLKALIGELHFVNHPGSFFHLPRSGGVSYAAQESWCLSETIRDNIVFGDEFDEKRYRSVLHDCGLEPDLKLLDNGDQTEIGEKGVTLSGGQKARVTLARSVYAQTEVVLLDDIFSALDTLTSRFIIDNLFRGPLMKDRTVLLITHHIGLVAPMADFMLALNEDGTIRSAGPIEDVLDHDEELAAVVEKEKKEDDSAPKEDLTKPEEKKSAAKLIQAEEKAEGRISKKAMFSFFSTFGGPVFWILYFGLLLAGQGFASFETYWLGVWARAYDHARVPGEVSVPYFLGIYFVWVASGLITASASNVLFYLGAIKASRTIHKRLVDRIFGAYSRFLDVTPVGRLVGRFTKDMKSIDGAFTETFSTVAEITIGMIIKFMIVVSLVPLFSIPAIVIGAVGAFLGEVYIHGQLSVKREMSNAKSPLFSHFSAAVNGIVSIRAFGAQEKLRREARKRADKYTRAATAFYNLNRWVTVRIDMLGGLFAALLAAFLVYGPRMDASTAGFALNQAIAFSYTILWWVRLVNQMEVEGNSVERIQDYLVIDQEPQATSRNQPPAAWPTSGEIILDKLSAKYSTDGPTVLDNLEVTIKSGERVGIVGRTGSGKSTLALAILRMVPTTGSVKIDGLATEKINLEALRSNVTIIPQDPVLLSGSMRFNLDPFGDHDDAELNDALQSSGLGSVRQSTSGTATPQRLTLDSPIAAGGGNLSQGQRQLVALARALVRGSKLLILDEATASVDFETDTLIQQSIRNLPRNTTVLTVAHRLATVMDYDKILVLGAGKVLEFDAPGVLKDKKDSYFAKLVQAMEG